MSPEACSHPWQTRRKYCQVFEMEVKTKKIVWFVGKCYDHLLQMDVIKKCKKTSGGGSFQIV